MIIFPKNTAPLFKYLIQGFELDSDLIRMGISWRIVTQFENCLEIPGKIPYDLWKVFWGCIKPGSAWPSQPNLQKWLEWPFPVRAGLKRPSIKPIYFNTIMLFYYMGTKYQRIGEKYQSICLNQLWLVWTCR